MANAQNLKPFKKGQSGNLKGRPPKVPQLDALLADILGAETHNGKTEAHAILEAMVKAAKKGNVAAGVALLNRAYGQPKAPVAVEYKKAEAEIFNIDNLTREEQRTLLGLMELASMPADQVEQKRASYLRFKTLSPRG